MRRRVKHTSVFVVAMRPSEVPAIHAKRMEEYRNEARRNAMVDRQFPDHRPGA
jgi:hypothetical protein